MSVIKLNCLISLFYTIISQKYTLQKNIICRIIHYNFATNNNISGIYYSLFRHLLLVGLAIGWLFKIATVRTLYSNYLTREVMNTYYHTPRTYM
jgi:hypothetical protein